MSLSVDYIGRVSDIDMFGTSSKITSEEATLTFGSGAVVAGPYKEAQKFRVAKLKNGVRDTRFLDDEILRDVTIQSISILPGTFKLTLKFTFADDDANIIIPVGLSVGT